MSLVYVKDLIDGIILAAENPEASGKIYFIADERIYPWEEAFKIIARVLEKRTIPLKIPKSLVFILSFLSENFSRLLRRTTVFNTQKAKEITERYWVLDISKAKAELGFSPKYDIERGAKETVRWYKDKGWL